MIVFHFRFSKAGFNSNTHISFSGLWIRHRVNSLFFKQLERGVNVKGDSYTVSSINYKKVTTKALFFLGLTASMKTVLISISGTVYNNESET